MVESPQLGSPNCDVNSEALAVQLAGETAFGTKPHAFVLHPIVLYCGVLRVRCDLKRHEVTKVFASGFRDKRRP